MRVQVTLPASVYAAKQHALTYYMQRDGIVKSVEGLILLVQRAAGPLDGQGSGAHCGQNVIPEGLSLAAIALGLS